MQRVAAGDRSLPGLTSKSYHLAQGERLNETIARSWNRVRGAWHGFCDALSQLPEDDPAVGLTRERWLGVIFQELHYGRLPRASGLELDGRLIPYRTYGVTYPYTGRLWCGSGQADPGVAGAARSIPTDLQNTSTVARIICGNRIQRTQLRLLRDNVSLTVNHMLNSILTIMEGELYSDFALFWLLCHQSDLKAKHQDLC